ncbi:MAG: NAD(P)H-hydrate dehydratase [Promethearchaeota archaeon]|nr:MAG: NAD(P)H-hydrate dehydratase [Candidatus Lokiarchaeota archaeon]
MKIINLEEKISSEQVGILDNNAEWLGIPKGFLMECAGYSFTIEILKRYNLDEASRVLIFSGTGNNGGDAFVVARHLSAYSIRSTLVLLGRPMRIRSEEANRNWEIISNSLNQSIKTIIIRDSTNLSSLREKIENDVKKYALIIDGMLGTGVKGKIREPIASAIDLINDINSSWEIPIASIDVPSGYDPDTGKVNDKAVKADLVITFHRKKKGMKKDGTYIKDLAVKSIGIPYEASLFLGRGDLLPAVKHREDDYHKGQFGRMLVIGGSKNYSGAPAYSTLAGIEFGIDLVITYTPQIIADVLRNYSPNMIVRSHKGNWLNMDSFKEIAWLVDWSNAILIGPGLGQEEKTEELLVELLKKFREDHKRFVLDADALKLVKNHKDLLEGQSCIVTPHEGEFKIMTDTTLPPNDQIKNRAKIITEIAKDFNITFLVKGPYDYIADTHNLKLNRTGCPEMAIGGTGDVLAGLTTAFLATNNAPFNSACAAAFLNGYIGEYCKEHIGPRFTAMDMIDNINDSLSELLDFKQS